MEDVGCRTWQAGDLVRTEISVLKQLGVLFHMHWSVLYPLGVRNVGGIHQAEVLRVCHIFDHGELDEEGMYVLY